MTFPIVWLPDALDRLTDIWTDAVDRKAVTVASNRIDLRLAGDPLNEGESRDADVRIAFEPPLQVLFRVLTTERVVQVLEVGVFSPRP